MWFNISGAQSLTRSRPAVENRDNIAKTMTPAVIEEAQRRARICVKPNYKNCD
jgi:hypothetical protein